MTEFTRKHLDQVTVENLMETKRKSYVTLCIYAGEYGNIQLNAHFDGTYSVVKNSKPFPYYFNMEDAIKMYHSLFK